MSVTINENTYHIIQSIGRGAQGICFSAQTVTKEGKKAVYAIKRMEIKDKQQEKEIKKEVEALEQFKGHENVIELVDHGLFNGDFYLVFEYCQCTLGEYLQAKYHVFQRGKKNSDGRYVSFLSEYEIRYWLNQIMKGLASLHDGGCVHRDIKPDNLLLKQRMFNTSWPDSDHHFLHFSKYQLKLADFGFAKVLPDNFKTSSFLGTPPYLPPEIAFKNDYGKSVDIWSLGVFLFELVCGLEDPLLQTMRQDISKFSRQELVLAIRKDMKRLNVRADLNRYSISDNLRDLLSRMLYLNPSQRIDSNSILKHPFLTNSYKYDFSQLDNREDCRFSYTAPLPFNTAPFPYLEEWENINQGKKFIFSGLIGGGRKFNRLTIWLEEAGIYRLRARNTSPSQNGYILQIKSGRKKIVHNEIFHVKDEEIVVPLQEKKTNKKKCIHVTVTPCENWWWSKISYFWTQEQGYEIAVERLE